MGICLVALPAAALALIFDKKIEETLAPAFVLILLSIYVPGLFLPLTVGFMLSLAVSACSLIYILYMIFAKKTDIRSRILTWGALAFLIYIGFFAYYSFHRDFSHPDELYCWGLMAKNYYFYDRINSPLSTALSSDQTPLTPILGYYFARTWTGFDDSICLFGHDLYTTAFLIPVFAYIKSRINASRFTIVTASLLSLMVLSGMESFGFFLGDKVIAAGLCFFILFMFRYAESGDEYYYMAAVLDLLSLCLAKRMGAVFVSIALFIVIPMFMPMKKKGIIRLIIMALAPSVIIFSWFGTSIYDVMPIAAVIGGLILYYILGWLDDVPDKYRELVHVVAILMAVGAVMGYMIIILGTDGYAYAVLARFMKDFITITTENGYICLSYGLYVIIAFGAALFLRHRRLSDASGNVKHAGTWEVTFMWTVIAMIIYALIMLYFHIWQIGPMNDHIEGLVDRYMIPWEIMVVFMLIYVFYVQRQESALVYIFAGFVILLCISDSREMYGQLFAKHQCVGYYALSDAGIELEPGDLVYFIDEDNYFSYSDREFYYRMWPAKTNFIDQIFMGNSGRIEFTADELEQMIASEQYLGEPYDYLYLQTIDDDFADRYGSLFADVDDIASGHAYKVDVTDGDVILTLLN